MRPLPPMHRPCITPQWSLTRPCKSGSWTDPLPALPFPVNGTFAALSAYLPSAQELQVHSRPAIEDAIEERENGRRHDRSGCRDFDFQRARSALLYLLPRPQIEI